MRSTSHATVDVDTERSTVEYSRHVFGHFIEHFHRQIYGGIFEPGSDLSDEHGFRLDVVSALRELRVPNVRWPGGSFVSAYHWVDGIGAERTPVYDRAWRVTDPNTFGTDEFLTWCDLIGAEPYICTNAGTGSPEEMADWVEYTNLPAGSRWANERARNGWPEPRRVPFWSIGNENYMHWEVGAKTEAEWARFVAESAKIIRRTDESVALLAASIAKIEWVEPLLARAGRDLGYVSIHGYWDDLADVNTPAGYLEAISRSEEPERHIQEMRALILSSGHDHIKIAFDEWNLRGWHHPSGNSPEAIAARDLNDENSTYTMADAVFSACFLNSCIRNGDIVGMANIAPNVNARGPLFVHPGGIVKRTTFHLMRMFATLLGSRVVVSRVSSDVLRTGFGDVSMVDALVTVDEAGAFAIVIVNKSDSDTASVCLRFGGLAVSGECAGVELVGASKDSFNDIDHPNEVVPEERLIAFDDGFATFPAHSVTIFSCDGAMGRAS